MPRPTDMTKPPRSLAQMNEILRREIDPSIELIKGAGYFYGTFGKYGMLPSLSVCYLNSQSIAGWLADVRMFLADVLSEHDCKSIAEYDAKMQPLESHLVIVMDKRPC